MNSAKITIEPIRVAIGNDFKITLTKVTDIEGNELNFKNVFIEIEWQDIVGRKYFTTWNPMAKSLNCSYENGKLRLIFDSKKYKFKAPGKLKYRIHTRVADHDFSDGTFDVWSEVYTSEIALFRN